MGAMTSQPRWRGNLPIILAVLVAGGLLVSTLIAVCRWQHPFPVMDMVTVVDAYFRLPWSEFLFFQQDNEHLPWLAMPLFAADIAWFGAHGIFLIAVLLLLNGVIAVSLAKLYGSMLADRRDRIVVAIVSVAAFFWLFHAENLVWPKQIHMYLSMALFMAACMVMRRLDGELVGEARSGRWLWLGSSVLLLLTGSTFSFAYGVVGWLAYLLAALALRWPTRVLLLLLAAFAANLTLYLLAYAPAGLPTGHSSPVQALHDPLGLIWYVLHYLGHPWRRLLFTSREAGLVFAGLGLLASVYFMYRHARHRQSPTQVALLAVLLFSLGATAITALSRVSFGPYQAETLRYGVVQILFWGALIGLLWPHLGRLPGRWMAVLLLLLMLPFQSKMMGRLANDDAELWQAAVALAVGAEDTDLLRQRLFPDIGVLERTADALRERNMSVFASAPVTWLGQDLGVNAPVTSSDACIGWARLLPPDVPPSHIRVEGAAQALANRSAAIDWVVVAAADGRIVGLAHGGRWRGQTDITWLGYMMRDGMPHTAYAILPGDGRACPLPWRTDEEKRP